MGDISEIHIVPKWPKIDVGRGNARKLKNYKKVDSQSVLKVCQSLLNKHQF